MSAWTSEKPTKPGWYWFRDDEGNKDFVHVIRLEGGGDE